MKFSMSHRLAFAMTALLLAAGQLAASPPVAGPSGAVPLSPVDQLTSPIALYPDPLVALILPASTFPSEIAAAASYLRGGGNPLQLNVQPWDSCVKGLAHYPSVLQWMAENPDWTTALGAAFADNPSEVMASIQRLRTMAKAAATLGTTAQQAVVEEDGAISIEPAQPNVIYVPAYDPAVVFVAGPYFGYGGPFLIFGPACPIGPWLAYQLDWNRHALWHGNWRNWHNARGWGHPLFPGQPGFIHSTTAHIWTAPHHSQTAGKIGHSRVSVRAVRPGPMGGAHRPPRPAPAASPGKR